MTFKLGDIVRSVMTGKVYTVAQHSDRHANIAQSFVRDNVAGFELVKKGGGKMVKGNDIKAGDTVRVIGDNGSDHGFAIGTIGIVTQRDDDDESGLPLRVSDGNVDFFLCEGEVEVVDGEDDGDEIITFALAFKSKGAIEVTASNEEYREIVEQWYDLANGYTKAVMITVTDVAEDFTYHVDLREIEAIRADNSEGKAD